MQKLMFKVVTGIHTALYRLTRGRLGGAIRGFPVLLLTTTGRKTGRTRTTPLGYFVDGGDYVIIASYGGLPTNPAWFHNLKHTPSVTIQIKDRILRATAEQATGEDRAALWRKLIAEAPMYGQYEQKTQREIPLVRLHPADATQR